MLDLSPDAGKLAWLIQSFTDRVSGIRHALVLSSDGIPMVASADMERALAERFAAVASGFVGLSAGISGPLRGGRLTQVVMELENLYVLVTGISDGSCLAVVAELTADVGMIAYDMATLVDQCGRALTPALRHELQLAYQR